MSVKSVSTATTNFTDQTACVIGGGVAGLACAIALAQIGAKVQLFERANSFENVGAGLQLSPNAMRALAALGIQPDFMELKALRIFDGLNDIKLAELRLASMDMPYCVSHRADLIDCLGRRAAKLGVQVNLGSEKIDDLDADLVVAADGVRSKTRESITPSKPRFTGKMAWRALVPAEKLDRQWVSNVVQTFLGPEAHLVTYPLRNEALVNVVGIVNAETGIAENWQQQGDGTSMRAAFAGWSKRVLSLMDLIEHPMMWGLFDHEPLRNWQDGQTVLVGDAAHPLVPFFAQGAAMALEDAVVLANCLSRLDRAAALERFEKLRKPRTTAVTRAAWGNARLFHFKHPLMRFGRVATMPFLSRVMPSVFERRYSWVYAYDAKDVV
ncbi:MAG: FAD-dependent monooxygenase [Pseudomonadota bacterium]